MKYTMTLHPNGLSPLESAKAWYLRVEGKKPWSAVRKKVKTVAGKRPGRRALENAVKRQGQLARTEPFPKLNYANCGRKGDLTEEQRQSVVDFVTKWRSKRFCTAAYIIRELKLKVKKKTVHRALNKAGFTWRPVPRKSKLSPKELELRKAWVDARLRWTRERWAEEFGLVLDGVTLTRAPAPLSGKQKHAAQSITAMWYKEGEALDNDLHTHNRYGVQLGHKVPLWGGFTGDGQFTYKFWSEKPKLDQEIWAGQIKTAVKSAAAGPCIWHDNEKFLKQPEVYQEHGLKMVTFPPNSGDLNPIENVWSELRKHLAQREFGDVDANRAISAKQFRQRASQILNSFQVPKPGLTESYLQKLVSGMPRRLAKCKANNYGNCGK